MSSSVGSHMKRALVAASLVLAMGGALVGCGSDDDSDSASSDTSSSATASDSASASDDTSASASDDSSSAASSGEGDATTTAFCQAFVDFGTALGTVDPSAAPADIISEIKSEAEKLGDVDLPAGIPADAKSGFEATIGAIDDLPDDATLEDLGNLESGLSTQQQADAKTFNSYLETTCPQLSSGASSDDSASSTTVAPAPSASAS